MGRKRRGPWQRSQDGAWYTTIGRKSVKVGEAGQPYAEVEKAYFALLAKGEKPATVTVAWIVGAFLDDTERTKAPGTLKWYREHLDKCVAYFGDRLKPENLAGGMVDRWIAHDYGHLAQNTQHGAARAIVRAMNWAVGERHIERSPLIGYTKPSPTAREAYTSPEEYKLALASANGGFKDVLTFLWETGCRPQELRAIEAAWLDGPAVVFPVLLSKGKKRRRVIILNDVAREIAERLAKANPEGPIFRNNQGRPWTKDALNCAFVRLRNRTGIETLCAYTLRHGFATEALKSGIDTTTVGVLMGHANPGMVATVYQHLAQDRGYLLSQLGNRQAVAG
ncbi:tyrosine-type recombinase/integrase [Botrimarina mediterranea]|uniref:Tyrosine recombinase XerD n=1 Tax=Botrimarina mediterranea TaxID=2528022 RepID=A0A518K3T6_9BACT|nr:tyrosine-type recombinase/integrase [Botrimarina mediterranea]QDV72464.1 Tyrosine recombinase XerD [Botrimarina mediterranea]